jgi:hypothetical protein
LSPERRALGEPEQPDVVGRLKFINGIALVPCEAVTAIFHQLGWQGNKYPNRTTFVQASLQKHLRCIMLRCRIFSRCARPFTAMQADQQDQGICDF